MQLVQIITSFQRLTLDPFSVAIGAEGLIVLAIPF